MRIAVDIDGVKADFCGSFLPFVNKRYGTNFTKADITRYSFEEIPGFPIKTNKALAEELRMFAEDGGYRNLIPIEEARPVLEKLAKKHTLGSITKRPNLNGMLEDTKAWREQHFPDIFTDLYLVKRSKIEIALNKGYVLILDDDPEVARDASQASLRAILLGNPWNTEEEYPYLNHSRIKRATWQTMEEYLEMRGLL